MGTCAGLPTVQCVGTGRTPLMLMLTRSRIKVIIDKSAAFPASPVIDAPVHECHHSDEASDGSALTCTAIS